MVSLDSGELTERRWPGDIQSFKFKWDNGTALGRMLYAEYSTSSSCGFRKIPRLAGSRAIRTLYLYLPDKARIVNAAGRDSATACFGLIQ